MLSHTYGWTNVKSQVRAMAWYLNKQRNWDFDSTLNQLESAVAPAYDKFAADEDKLLSAAAAAQKSTPLFLSAGLLAALAFPPPPKPPPGYEKPVQTYAATAITMAPAPIWPWLLAGGVVLAGGGGYWLWRRKHAKAA
jgi:LPXTG-motif cell wall-anchored protein